MTKRDVTTDQIKKPDPTAEQTEGKKPEEIGGRKGLDPTRYGDYEIGGKCVDF